MVLDIHVGGKKKKNYDHLHLTIHKIDFKGLSDLNITAESFVSREKKKKKNSIESWGWQRFLRKDTQSTNCQKVIFLSKFKIFSFSKISVSK